MGGRHGDAESTVSGVYGTEELQTISNNLLKRVSERVGISY
jgi:hypothetical protein